MRYCLIDGVLYAMGLAALGMEIAAARAGDVQAVYDSVAAVLLVALALDWRT